MTRPLDMRAFFNCCGDTVRWFCFAAERSSAAAPAVIGEAIDVPWIIS